MKAMVMGGLGLVQSRVARRSRSEARSRPGAGAHEGGVAEFPRSAHARRQIRRDAEARGSDPAVRRCGRDRRGRRRRAGMEDRRPRGRLLLSVLAGWRGAGISAARRAGRARRWRRVPVSRVQCRRDPADPAEPELRRGGDVAVRRDHGLECGPRRAQDRTRTCRADARDRRRLAVRAAIREGRGRDRDRDLVERREARSG